MQSSVKQRLISFISYIKLSQSKFEKEISVSNGYVNNIRQSISPDKLQKIALRFPELNIAWLITGDGDMINNADCALSSSTPDEYEEILKRIKLAVSELSQDKINQASSISSDWLIFGKGDMINESGCNKITYSESDGQPFYDVDFVGGFDLMCNDQTIKPAYYINYKPFSGKEGVMWVNLTGRSMEPELNHGDMIAIKEATTPIEYLPAGEIYAIVTEDFRTVKRISKSDREGFVRLIPSNKSEEYTPQDIPVSIIRKVFYVLGSFKNF